jgi:hypothetical protein
MLQKKPHHEPISQKESLRRIIPIPNEGVHATPVERNMPGSKHRFTAKEDREAKHIMESETERGRSEKDAERIGYATVNKQKSKRNSA